MIKRGKSFTIDEEKTGPRISKSDTNKKRFSPRIHNKVYNFF